MIRDWSNVSADAGPRFSDPFILPSSQGFPTSPEESFTLARFLWHLVPEFRAATMRLVSHFITEVDFVGDTGSIEERDELRKMLYDTIDLKGALRAIGACWGCFQGDTKVVLRNGVASIKDLAGQRLDVLSKGGVYRSAEFKSFGVQELLEVEFSDGTKILATPEHQWEILNAVRKPVRVPTTALRPSHQIERTTAPRPEKNEEYSEGVRHGFIFGDGSLSTKGSTKSVALFMGKKDAAMLPYFEGHGNAPRVRPDHKETIRQSGFPGRYKKLPERSASASYWYGFVSGFLAADGNVDKRDGVAVLTQKSRETLEAIKEQLPRIGMVAGKMRAQDRVTNLSKWQGKPAVYESTMHFMTLLKRFMQPGDFLIPAHRENFEANQRETKYGKYIGVKSVRPTGKFEEVFCCVEMETHTFVIDNGILTGNCFGNGFGRIHLPFDRHLIDMRGGSYRVWPVSMFRNMPQAQYNWERLTYTVPDPLDMKKNKGDSAKMVEFEFVDRRVADPSRVKIIHLNPDFLLLEKAYQNDTIRITDRFDPEFIADIRNNRMHQINNTPATILRAVKTDSWLRYDEDEVFHLAEPPIPGITNSGWGCPPAITNYRSLHRLMVYMNIDEAVGRDYMLPFRVVTPNPGTGISDAALKVMLGPWKQEMRKMFSVRRKDAYAFHTLPFPVNYQEFAASGKELSPKEHIDWHTNAMLNAMGYPAELFTGSMAIQQIPTAMRILEMNFQFLQHGLNMYTKWITRRLSEFLQRPYIEPELQTPRVADDLEQRGVYLQLISGGEIPRRVGYEKWGIKDPVEAAKERMREDMSIQKAQAELQEEAQREQQMGSMSAIVSQRMQQVTQPGAGPAAGGAGGAPGQGPSSPMVGNITPLDVMSQADAEAHRLLPMPEGQRFTELRKLEASNEPLHAAVKQRMEKIRSQGASVGRQNAMQILSGG